MSSHFDPLEASAATMAEVSTGRASQRAVTDHLSAGVLLLALTAAMLVFLPVIHLPLPFSDYDQKRLAELLLLAAAAVAFAASARLRRNVAAELSPLPTTAWVALALVLALGVASSLAAASPRHAFAEMGLLFGLALLAVTVAGALRPVLPMARQWLMRAILLMLSLYLVRLTGAYLAWLTTVQLSVPELLVGLGHPRFFGHWQTLTLPLAVLPVLLLRSPLARGAAVLVASLWWAIAFGGGGRGVILGVGVAVAITSVLAPRARAWSLTQVLCALLGLALAFVMFELPTRSSESFVGVERLADLEVTAHSNESRLVLLVESTDAVFDHPLLGLGPMHFAAVGERGHPHNIYAQLAVEWGLPATALILALALGAAVAWWRLLPAARDTHVLRPALAASLLAAAVHGLVSGLIVPAYSQLWIALLSGFALCEFNEMLAPYGREQDRRAGPGADARKPVFATSLVLGVAWVGALGTLGALCARDLPLVARSMEALHTRQVAGAPRFWQYGYIDEERSLQALVDGRPLRERPRYTLEAAMERAHLPFESE